VRQPDGHFCGVREPKLEGGRWASKIGKCAGSKRVYPDHSVHSLNQLTFFFLFVCLSVWDNETWSAEAFQGHPFVLPVVDQTLPGKFVQEEILLCTII
jgi:hypothetical protein